jgi:hypothetical protein
VRSCRSPSTPGDEADIRVFYYPYALRYRYPRGDRQQTHGCHVSQAGPRFAIKEIHKPNLYRTILGTLKSTAQIYMQLLTEHVEHVATYVAQELRDPIVL